VFCDVVWKITYSKRTSETELDDIALGLAPVVADVADDGSQSQSVCKDAPNGSLSAQRRRTSSRTASVRG